MSRPKLKINGKSILLHRYIWEQANGPIPEGHEIHHKDHDPMNNVLENLECLTAQDHRDHHAAANTKYPKEKRCEVCNELYEPAPTKRARSKTCSRKCWGALASRQRTENNGNRKVTPQMREQIHQRLAAGDRQCDLATEFGLSRATLSRVAATRQEQA